MVFGQSNDGICVQDERLMYTVFYFRMKTNKIVQHLVLNSVSLAGISANYICIEIYVTGMTRIFVRFCDIRGKVFERTPYNMHLLIATSVYQWTIIPLDCLFRWYGLLRTCRFILQERAALSL